ncbi:MAG: hypothetical protein ACRCTS_06790 [Fusobacteriaceae bacterium]
MEKYLVTEVEKQEAVNKFPVLSCKYSVGVDYGYHFSVKCTAFLGTCTYMCAGENGNKDCVVLKRAAT